MVFLEAVETTLTQVYLKSVLKDQFKPSLLLPIILIIINIGVLFI